MRWEEVTLSKPSPLKFGDGTAATLSWRIRETHGGGQEHGNVVKVDFSCGGVLELQDAVDSGETVEEPRVHVLYGRQPAKVLLFGGPVAYRLNSIGTMEKATKLYREFELDEYWATRIVETNLGLMIVYESGILLVDEDLNVKWQRKKHLNDFFSNVIDSRARFLRDHEEEWSLSLIDGSASIGTP